jgi:hypothetical protein
VVNPVTIFIRERIFDSQFIASSAVFTREFPLEFLHGPTNIIGLGILPIFCTGNMDNTGALIIRKTGVAIVIFGTLPSPPQSNE